MSEVNLDKVKNYLIGLQETLCKYFEEEDGQGHFIKENWQHSTGGGGCTRVIADGKVIEKGGINFSHVKGKNLPASASAHRPHLANCHFQAIGLSLVMHPINPYVPTVHANLRFFYAEEPSSKKQIWWFGGGLDLTPFYGFTEDCQHWHRTAQAACIPFGNHVYPRYKKWCDEYFYLKHRQEPRGIGGLFFDDLNEWEFEKCLAFWQNIGDHFWPAYYPIINNRKNHLYGPSQRAFQAYRRGRYVEFNLLYDRGTLFGLQSAGRTESILMSLPPQVSWQYNWQPEAGSEEAQLYEKFLPVQEWVK